MSRYSFGASNGVLPYNKQYKVTPRAHTSIALVIGSRSFTVCDESVRTEVGRSAESLLLVGVSGNVCGVTRGSDRLADGDAGSRPE
jgi:hypothetical protein